MSEEESDISELEGSGALPSSEHETSAGHLFTDDDVPEDFDAPGAHDPTAISPKRRAVIRLGILAFTIATLYIVAVATGLDQYLTTENVRAMMTEAGPWGLVVFVAIFIVGNLVQIPSNVFLLAAIYSLGFAQGTVLSYFANVFSVYVSFMLVRTVGGQPLALVKRPWLRKALDQLDHHPIRAIFVMRSFLGGSPPLNYTLAMSEVRFRDYALGSALGMIAPVTVVCFLMSKAVG